jgi:drug/metabolite transporter (DMT)-like permease
MVDAEQDPEVERRRRMLSGVVAALLGASLWGVNGTIVSYMLERYNMAPLWLVCVRELGACVLFLLTAWLTNKERLTGIFFDRRSMVELIVSAFSSFLLSNVCYVEAIRWTNSATATVLQSLNIIMVAVYVCVKTRRSPRRRELVAMALAIGGTYLLATGGNPGTLQLPAEGFAWGMGAALAMTFLAILPIRILNKWGSFVVNGLAMLISGVVLALFIQPWANVPVLDAVGWALVVLTVVLGTFGAYALYLHGVKIVGSMRGAMLGTAEPLVAMLTTVLFTSVWFAPTDLVAFAMIICMVYLAA